MVVLPPTVENDVHPPPPARAPTTLVFMSVYLRDRMKIDYCENCMTIIQYSESLDVYYMDHHNNIAVVCTIDPTRCGHTVDESYVSALI